MKIGAIVLAGGRSRRMGRPKESLPFGDSTLLCHTAETLSEWTYPVVIVGRDASQELPPLPIEIDVVFDAEPDQGPLVGILTGLRDVASQCEAVYVTGCDAPFLDGKVVDWLGKELADYDLVIAKIGGIYQPLGALYRTSLLPTIERLVLEGYRTPRELVEHAKARVLTEAEVDAFDPTRSFLRNLNTPDDYEAAKRTAAGE